MKIGEAIKFLEIELVIDDERCSYKQFSEQMDKLRKVIKLLQRINEFKCKL